MGPPGRSDQETRTEPGHRGDSGHQALVVRNRELVDGVRSPEDDSDARMGKAGEPVGLVGFEASQTLG